MNTTTPTLLQSLKKRVSTVEATLTRRENILSFLVVRFVFMSGMVLGFSWYFLNLSP
jgi:hypothetical protein